MLDLAQEALGSSPGTISYWPDAFVGQSLEFSSIKRTVASALQKMPWEKEYRVLLAQSVLKGCDPPLPSHPVLNTSRLSSYLAHIANDIVLL